MRLAETMGFAFAQPILPTGSGISCVGWVERSETHHTKF